MSRHTDGSHAVMVGYDGSPGARGALLHAAGEAAIQRRTLRVVYVKEGPPDIGASAAEILTRAAEIVHRDVPGVHATYTDEHGAAGALLVELSHDCDLLVVGRGAHGFFGPVLGSVAYDVVHNATCPVSVVNDASSTYRPSSRDVVVGVDLREDNAELLDAAFAEASARHAGLVVVHACAQPVPAGEGVDTWSRVGVEPGLADLARSLHGAVREVHGRFPAVAVTEVIAQGSPGPVLRDAAASARLVMVGGRGRGPIATVFLGSVGQYLLRHAHCPVIVAPAPPRESARALLLLGGP